MRNLRYVAACEALAEAFENQGRLDLAALCDKAAFWLEGGPRIEHLSLEDVVQACREAICLDPEAQAASYATQLQRQVRANLSRIAERIGKDSIAKTIEAAARARAVAILTEKLL
jgi:hypothetical protein